MHLYWHASLVLTGINWIMWCLSYMTSGCSLPLWDSLPKSVEWGKQVAFPILDLSQLPKYLNRRKKPDSSQWISPAFPQTGHQLHSFPPLDWLVTGSTWVTWLWSWVAVCSLVFVSGWELPLALEVLTPPAYLGICQPLKLHGPSLYN